MGSEMCIRDRAVPEGLAVSIYAALINKKLSEDERAQAIASGFEQLENRYPRLQDVATQQELKNTELKLIKEIEKIRADLSKDIEQVRVNLSKDIEQVRANSSKDTEKLRFDLSKEIAQVRADLANTKVSLIQWVIGLLMGQTAVILGIMALLMR